MRVYRALLWIFPPGYRARHGAALERLFRDTRAAWTNENGKPGIRFWMPVAWDTVRSAAVAWADAIRDVARPDPARSMGEMMTSLFADLRFALRQIVRQPAHGLMIVLLMTLGVAGNTAVFRIVDGLFLKPLPFESPDRLVDFDETAPQWDLEYVGVAYPDFVRWRAENHTFAAMAVYGGGGANLADGNSAERVSEVLASHDLDDVLGFEPTLGRFFSQDEDQPDGARVALLTQGFWERRFASDPAVLGTTVSLDGEAVEIIGVLPPEADFVEEADLWLPLQESVDRDDGWYLTGIGRLKEGATLDGAAEDLRAIHESMRPERKVNEITSPVLHSLRDRYLGEYRASTGFLLGAVVVVLLIACANIAGLMFARSLARGPEIGVRIAMGAPRGRIVRQLLTESAVLAVFGTAAGAALGVWGSGRLVGRLSEQFPSWVTFGLDGRMLAFTLALTAGSVILFGLTPALSAASNPGLSLSGGGRSTASARRRRMLSSLVAAEVALAVTLLVVGGLSMLDAWRVGRIDPGFTANDVTVFRLRLPQSRYADSDARLAFAERYVDRLQQAPGVQHAAIANNLPLMGHQGMFYVVEDAPPRPEGESNPVVLTRSVTPGYFETMGVRIVRGRALDAFDGRDDGSLAAVVNETFVRTHMADGRDPIGRRISTGGSPASWMTVVGVAHDVKHYGLDQVMRPGIYIPIRQMPLQGMLVAIRTGPGAGSPLAEVRRITTELDPELAVYGERTMSEVVDESLWTRRATSWLIGAFSTVALLLAVAGLYGVISYSVGQRAREISVRMAVGARAAQVSSQVVRQGMTVAAVGVVIGLGAALALGGLLSRMLSQVTPREPWIYLAVCAILGSVATVANWLPARRAATTDPMKVLRAD